MLWFFFLLVGWGSSCRLPSMLANDYLYRTGIWGVSTTDKPNQHSTKMSRRFVPYPAIIAIAVEDIYRYVV